MKNLEKEKFKKLKTLMGRKPIPKPGIPHKSKKDYNRQSAKKANSGDYVFILCS
jgi:hypothetical protein